MKIELTFEWFLNKLRVIFLIAVFYLLWRYAGQVWAFMWLGYFILNDLADTEQEIADLTAKMDKIREEERKIAFKGLTKRNNF